MSIYSSAPCFRALVLAVLILGGLSASQVRAQEANRDSIPLEEGAWALQFATGEDFTLAPFIGSAISAKKHTSPARAWQFGVGASTFVRSGRGEGRSRDRASFEVTTRYLAYPLLGDQDTEAIQLVLGAGPLVSFNRNSVGRPGEGDDQTVWRWGIGASGTIGAEWFVRSRISLSGAYETSLRFQHERSVFEEREDQTDNLFQLSSGRARLGVSAYF